jgi:hypothetical protein
MAMNRRGALARMMGGVLGVFVGREEKVEEQPRYPTAAEIAHEIWHMPTKTHTSIAIDTEAMDAETRQAFEDTVSDMTGYNPRLDRFSR